MNLSVGKGASVFLTGGSGVIGGYALKGLSDAGYRVTSFDRVEPKERKDGVEYVVGDINDFNFLMDHMNGMDAVVHLAALPSPDRGSTREIMRINVLGTFHVFQAAVKTGIKKIVQASSINYLGIAFGVKMFRPQYFPIDEEHPPCISDAYSLSKKMDEEIAEYFWSRDSFPSFSLRFPGMFDRYWLQNHGKGDYFEKVIEEIEKMSEKDRISFVENIFDSSKELEFRRNAKKWSEANEDERMEWAKAGYTLKAVRDLFAYLEFSDCVQSLRKCLEADLDGTHPLFINGPDTGRKCETARIIRTFFPWVGEFKKPISGNEPLVSSDKARKLVGFSPEFSAIG
jgi:nucleoside-diphosphate-sugar epimerase